MSKELQYILYQLSDQENKVQVVVKNEIIWMTQRSMSELFGVQTPAISKHLKNIFESGELDMNTTISKMETVVNRGYIAK